MRKVRPLLIGLLLASGVLVGTWIGTGSGQGTAPPRPPGDEVQQAQTPQTVPSTRPEQRQTPLERFVDEAPRGPTKTFTLRGIKDSPPYLHDGRLLTLEDTVEFFNLILGLEPSHQEKADLVAFMRQL